MAGRDERDHEFTQPIGAGLDLRFRFDLDRGRVTEFTVQLECWIESRWRPVARYDTAHGTPHRDMLDWHGGVVEKDWLPSSMAYNEAMKVAAQDLKDNAEYYRESFLERKP